MTRYEITKNEGRLVQLTNGEAFIAGDETPEGVEFDGGVIPWGDVAGFWSYYYPTDRAIFTPA